MGRFTDGAGQALKSIGLTSKRTAGKNDFILSTKGDVDFDVSQKIDMFTREGASFATNKRLYLSGGQKTDINAPSINNKWK